MLSIRQDFWNEGTIEREGLKLTLNEELITQTHMCSEFTKVQFDSCFSIPVFNF